MLRTRFTFIRNSKGFPIGGIAYQIDSQAGEMFFGLSQHNVADSFNRKIAKDVAVGRLSKCPMVFNFDVKDNPNPAQLLKNLAEDLVSSYDGKWKMTGILSKKMFLALKNFSER